ncbi:MAG: hypothetical protein HY560_14155 [Gemmatimonadetes bacterium]|nr:hypothetical protein [Gemmatimonadota bacterium]
MITVIAVLRIAHVLTAVLMAWPYYALLVVNQRARLGPPLGDRADVYLENIIKNRTIPCFVFQATALITGLALLFAQGLGPGALLTTPALGVKFVLLLAIAASLSYVHFRLQPQIDALLAQAGPAPAPDLVARIGALRLQRKRMATGCLFVVLVSVVLGVHARGVSTLGVTLFLIVATGLFSWRTYRSVTPYGWW